MRKLTKFQTRELNRLRVEYVEVLEQLGAAHDDD